jgi:AraC-like DNA-binding protein
MLPAEMCVMPARPLPRDVKKAIDLLRCDLTAQRSITDLARLCGVPRRTLEKHFRRFVGCAPLEFLRRERFNQARRQLLKASPGASVAVIALDCGLTHLGRFAQAYRSRYGESPSDTLRLRRVWLPTNAAPVRLTATLERPSLAIMPFDLIGPLAIDVSDIGDEIASAVCRTGWIRIVTPPAGRYHLHGRVKDDGTGTLRIRLTLLDRSNLRYIWADCSECADGDLLGSRDWFASHVSGALRSVLRDAEIDHATAKEPAQLTAWELAMRALPMVLAADPSAHAVAIELLDQAIECAPRDPVPLSLAAWCHGLRAGHHFTRDLKMERDKALQRASEASALGPGDPMSDAMLSAAYMLAHDLAAAEVHARRALSIDGGSAWGWGRLAWVYAYRGDTARALECCQIARVLAPSDPLSFVWSIGIAAANFEHGLFDRAIDWYRRALAEQPKAIWINRFLAPAAVFAGQKDKGRQSLIGLSRAFPELTIAQVRAGLPHTDRFLDRVAEGLETLGMPYC